MDAIQRAIQAARLADSKKAEDIDVLDLRGVCTFTDAFVICTGATRLQLKAIGDAIVNGIKEIDNSTPLQDGARSSTWAVLDYGDFVVHIMSPESRDYYRIEDIWGDGKAIDWAGKEVAVSE